MAIELYRTSIEAALRRSIEEMGEKSALRDACEYALLNEGKRLRPILVLMIADAIGLGAHVEPAALSVEFFHTASLIADDLPCMDNEDFRRERPSLHKVFGESIAILTSYALIAEGYGGIAKNSQNCPSSSLICLEAARRCAGIHGATNGQVLDLFPPDTRLETIQKIIYQKTVTLFEISFIFGWIFGGGHPEKLEEVKRCAYHLGMAFQIADDLIDLFKKDRINIALALGKETAVHLFDEEMDGFVSSSKKLGLWGPQFQQIRDWLTQMQKATLMG